MSGKVTVNLRVSGYVSPSNSALKSKFSVSNNINATIARDGFIHRQQSIGTAEETLDFGAVLDFNVIGWVYIKNLSDEDTDTVKIGSSSGNYTILLNGGESVAFRLFRPVSLDQIFLIASTNLNVEYLLLED